LFLRVFTYFLWAEKLSKLNTVSILFNPAKVQLFIFRGESFSCFGNIILRFLGLKE